MMNSSLRHQQQTHSLSKLRRFATSTARHHVHLPLLLNRRFSIITLGMLVGIGLPALAFASQQQLTTDSSSEVSNPKQPTHPETSSQTEEVISTSTINMQVGSTSDASEEVVGQATINGETIPLTNGSTTTRSIENDSNAVDVDISINSNDASTSISSSSSTDIHIENHNSSDNGTNNPRGSPRR